MVRFTVGRRVANWCVGVGSVLVAAAACGSDTTNPANGPQQAGSGGVAGSGKSGDGPSSEAGSGDGGSPQATAGTSTTGGSSMAGSSSGASGSSTGGVGGGGGVAGGGSGGTVSEAGMPSVGEGGSPIAGAGGDGAGEGGSTGAGEAGATGEAGAGGSACGGALTWQRRSSNVMFLIDRSGTMFEPIATPPWPAVRDAALPVIDAFDSSRKIGFMSMAGEFASCPLFDEVAPASSNYAAISAKYTGLGKPVKGESPFMLALTRAAELLGAVEGERYVILVIDGEPDYCNDGENRCPIDSVVAKLQALKAAGITTLVAGLPNIGLIQPEFYASELQSFANAGAGLPVASVGDTPVNIYNSCYFGNTPEWKTEFVASGKPASTPLGNYSAVAGNAPYVSLDPTNPVSMGATFTSLFSRTGSCSFELASGQVSSSAAAQASVKIDGTSVPFDIANGFHLESASVLAFSGTACDKLQASSTAQVTIDFPCAP